MKKMLLTLLAALLATMVFSQIKNNPWQDALESSFASEAGKRNIVPSKYRTLSLDQAALEEILGQAPMRYTTQAPTSLTFPMPDGAFQHFTVVEAPIMHPDLAAKYPYIRTYAGWSKEDPTAYARFGVTQKGFHAVIFSARHSTVFIDAFAEGDTEHYSCYFKKDFHKEGSFSCLVEDTPGTKSLVPVGPVPKMAGDCNLRIYDLALACTGEYAQYHGGTVPSVMAEFAIAMTRVNGIYEREAAATMQLVPNTDLLIFLNPNTDPYTNGNGGTMLNQNQTTCNNIIGNANYDIGHVFSTGGGGVAFLNSVCSTNNKAKGVTGLSEPTGDPFWVDYVAHEMGHQFGGNHTQNNSCNRNNATAMEPGSASTIMGYAGICAPNVQSNSDDYFHAINLDEITAHVTGFGNTCATSTNTGNSAPSVSVAAGAYAVPVSTPLVLTAIATDPDGDVLTYCWEQMNNQSAPMPPQATNTSGPAFRSLSPQESPSRYLPGLPTVINGAESAWEVLPAVGRTMLFRCTVRDNHPGAGCTAEADVVLNFTANAGPFRVSEPNTPAVVWTANLPATVTWDVANTDAAPVNCNLVDILLSVDGGFTYPHTLLAQTPNDGSQAIIVPNVVTEKARVMVRSSSNVFYDISDQDFTIELPAAPIFLLTAAPEQQAVCMDSTAAYLLTVEPIAGFDETISFSASDGPPGATVTFTPATAMPPATVLMEVGDLQNAAPGNYVITVLASSLSLSQTVEVSLTVQDSIAGAVELYLPSEGETGQPFGPTLLTWQPLAGADEYVLEVSTNPSFLPLFYTVATTATDHAVPDTQEGTVYYWRVSGKNACNQGPFSGAYAFQTAFVECVVYNSTTTPVNIPDDEVSIVTDVIVVENQYPIVSVKVHVNLSHTYVGDLIVNLETPQVAPILLFDRPGVPASDFGCSGDDLLVNFYDFAPLTAEDLENTCDPFPPTINGDFQPIAPLSALNGLSGSEEWVLVVEDVFPEDGGAIKDWTVEVCTGTPQSPGFLVNNNVLVVDRGQLGEVTKDLLEAGGLPAQTVYTLLTVPAHGTLFLSGNPLAVGSLFSQAQINNGQVVYVHDGSATSSDGFFFDLLNSANGWLHNQFFQIQILDNGLAASAILTQAIDCFNADNAIITITATGGTAPLEYSLNGGTAQASNVFENLGPGAYTAEVTDSTGFTITTNEITIDDPAQIVASASVNGADITVDASGGTGALQYSLDGGPFQSNNVFENLPAGTYTITVQDENGCTETVTAGILPSPLVVTAVITQAISCFGENIGEIAVTAAGGSVPYEYSLNGGPFQSSNIFQNLGPGTYTIEVMDADVTVQATGPVELTEPAQMTASAIVTGNSITVDASGGTGTLQYRLDGGPFQSSPVFENLPNGTYTITVQDENGCTATVGATVSVSSLVITAAVTQAISCFGENDGEITVTIVSGAPPFEYSLNGGPFQGSNVFQGLGAGMYIATVMDGDGFPQNTLPLQIAAPAQINGTVQVNGYTVEVVANGGTGNLTYSIDGGPFQADNLFFPVPGGDHEVTVRDGNGCEAIISFEVNVPALNAAAFISQALPCWDSAEGEITVIADGGVPPYGYSLNGGPFQPENVFGNLAPGNYTVTVQDTGGFTFAAATIMLTAPPALVVMANVAGSTITVDVSGGTLPYQYQLDGGDLQPANFFLDVPDGTHIVNVVDGNGCEMSVSVTVSSVPAPVIAVSIEQEPLCFGDSTAVVSVQVNGGLPPFQFSLNGGDFQDGDVFIGLPAGQYLVAVQDANGTVFTAATVTVASPPAIMASASALGLTITVTASGGTGDLLYSLDGGPFQNSNEFSVAINGVYAVAVMDENGCTVQVTVVVSVPVAMQFVVNGPSCQGLTDGLVVIQSVTGGIPPYLYSMNGGPFTPALNYPGLLPGEYIFTVQDATGYQFEAPPVMVVDPLPVEALMEIDGNTLTVNASGGTAPYLFSINGGQSFQAGNVFPNLPNNVYEVVVVDENGCAYGTTVTINYTAVRDVQGQLMFEVMPNPSDGLFTLRMDMTVPAKLNLAVFDVAGRLVFRSSLQAGTRIEERLDLRFLANGSYQLRVDDNRAWGVKQLIIIR